MKLLMRECKECGKPIYSYLKDDLCGQCGYEKRGYRQCESCKQPLKSYQERMCGECERGDLNE